MRREFSTEEQAYIREHYYDMETIAIARAIGTNSRVVQRWAEKHGLTKHWRFDRKADAERWNLMRDEVMEKLGTMSFKDVAASIGEDVDRLHNWVWRWGYFVEGEKPDGGYLFYRKKGSRKNSVDDTTRHSILNMWPGRTLLEISRLTGVPFPMVNRLIQEHIQHRKQQGISRSPELIRELMRADDGHTCSHTFDIDAYVEDICKTFVLSAEDIDTLRNALAAAWQWGLQQEKKRYGNKEDDAAR